MDYEFFIEWIDVIPIPCIYKPTQMTNVIRGNNDRDAFTFQGICLGARMTNIGSGLTWKARNGRYDYPGDCASGK